MFRPGVRLVVLDEAFRGLDRGKRRELLARARAWWRGATLLSISHDVSDTLNFDRVLVIEGGRIVEDAPPQEAAGRSGSRFRSMLAAEEDVRTGLWSAADWRRLTLDHGRISQPNGGGTS